MSVSGGKAMELANQNHKMNNAHGWGGCKTGMLWKKGELLLAGSGSHITWIVGVRNAIAFGRLRRFAELR